MILERYEDIADDFSDSLILGNGASIALSNNFQYNSLYEIASKEGFITDAVAEIFELFDTTDFEFVLSHLWYAREINSRLSIIESKTKASYELIKKALINTILKIHPKPSDVCSYFNNIAAFTMKFQKVFSLNYDLLLYWAMLRANEELNCNHFKDCFYHTNFSDDWHYYEEPRPPATTSTLVFYPHGNLYLLEKLQGKTTVEQDKEYDEGEEIFGLTRRELKIESDNQLLLDEIVDRWQVPGTMPLFVSEGTWKEKLASINSSGYLSEIYYSALNEMGKNITVFGWAIGDKDEHILKAIKRANVQSMAISVHKPSTSDIDQHTAHIRAKLKQAISDRLKTIFFDAESNGCWIN